MVINLDTYLTGTFMINLGIFKMGKHIAICDSISWNIGYAILT